MDDTEYEELCKKIRDDNEEYLTIFERYLTEAGFSDKTIHSHLGNADFYLNDFLLYAELIPMEEGGMYINEFLGFFFIRKCMWSTPGTIKTTAASLKKFYKCMLENGKITKADYNMLCGTIKENMELWQEDCRKYNDPCEENPFAFF